MHMLVFLVVLPVKSEYLRLKADTRKGSLVAAMLSPSGASTLQLLPLSAHRSTAALGVVLGWPRLAAQHPRGHLLIPLLSCITGEKIGRTRVRRLVGQDKGWVTAYQLPLWAKHT